MKRLFALLLVFLTLNLFAAPTITVQPTTKTNLVGSTNTFSVTATGTAPLRYRWYYSGYTNVITGTNAMGVATRGMTNKPFALLNGATNNSLVKIATTTNLGRYFVTVSNTTGVSTSSIVTLAQTNPPPRQNTTFVFNWTNSPSVTKFELLSTTNLLQPFTLLTNLGKSTNFVIDTPKTNLGPQRFFKLIAYQTTTTQTVASVTLAWDPSPDASVTGYRIYQGGISGIYTNSYIVGNTLTSTIANLKINSTYYFAATAYDSSGMQSIFSNEALYTVAPSVVVNTVGPWPVSFTVIQ